MGIYSRNAHKYGIIHWVLAKILLISTIFLALYCNGCARTPELSVHRDSPFPFSDRQAEHNEPLILTGEQDMEYIKAKIKELIGRMTSDNYKDREKATITLCKLLRESGNKQLIAVQYLQELCSNSVDPEVMHRLEPLINRYIRPWKGLRILRILIHNDEVATAVFRPDGKLLASVARNKAIRIWDPKTGKLLRTLGENNKLNVSALAFSPDGKLLASAGGDKTIHLWNPLAGKCLHILRLLNDRSCRVSFSPDGKLLAALSDDEIKVWKIDSGKPLHHILLGVVGGCCSIGFDMDGKILASGNADGTVCLWNTSNGDRLLVLRGHKGVVTSVAFSPEQKKLASAGCDKSIRIWDIETGKCLQVLKGHETDITCVAFEPNCRYIVSSGLDNSIRIWDASTGENLTTYSAHTHSVWSISFTEDGMQFATASSDKTVLIWGIPEDNEKVESQIKKPESDKKKQKPTGKE